MFVVNFAIAEKYDVSQAIMIDTFGKVLICGTGYSNTVQLVTRSERYLCSRCILLFNRLGGKKGIKGITII